MELTPTYTLTDWLAYLITGLQKTLGIEAHRTRMPGALAALTWNRLSWFRARILGYIARYRAGTLRPAAVKRPRPATAERFGPPAPKPAVMLPRQFGWMLKLAPGTISTAGAAQWVSVLQHMLDHPELAAMLATAPQLARVLRPFCHMMGFQPLPAALRLPKRPRAPRKQPAPPAIALSPSEIWAANLRWPHVSLARRWPKWMKQRDDELDAFLAARKKQEEAG